MIDLSQEHIMQNWKTSSPPLISILCVTYNHQAYIEEALNSLLSQETNFPFEIIVHDDASTDSTPAIIKKYAEKYPQIIKSVLQTINQQSQKRKPYIIAFSSSRGSYIAICDGDDCWTSISKLQLQVEEMKRHPQCQISFHPAIIKRNDGKKIKKILAKHSKYNKIFTTSEIINGDGGFCPSSSLMIDRKIFESLPIWFDGAPIADYFLQILGSLNGGALYINKPMSIYRVVSVGSWSERITKDEALNFFYFNNIIKAIDSLNQHTGMRFHQEMNTWKKRVYTFMCRTQGVPLHKRRVFFMQHKSIFNLKDKIMWHLIYKNTRMYLFLRKLKHRGVI